MRERTGCTAVALQRDGAVSMDFPADLKLAKGDALYICGTADAIARYREEFPADWLEESQQPAPA